ncbi:MAG: Y-family DNA polymerase [Bacteroidota bacterium]
MFAPVSPSRVFALVDASNFYVSCERVFRPDLRTRPVVVLSNNDGCIVSRSEEVKRAGIENGSPFFKARRQLAAMGAEIFSSNYELYGDFSHRVMGTLETFTPDVEPYSIDEAFLVFSTPRPQDRDPARLSALAKQIQQRVLRWTGIPVRVSFATTKTLCKVGSELARSRGGTINLVWRSARERDDLLGRVPVGDVWGVGHRTEAKLTARGFHTARDLRDAPDAWVRKTLHTVGMRTVYELRGVSCLPLERAPRPRHTLLRSRSFGAAVTDPTVMREALATHASAACRTLRAEGLAARRLQVLYRTGRHGTGPGHSVSLGTTFETPVSSTAEIVAATRRLLERSWRSHDHGGRPLRYKKAGILLVDLCQASQTDLFGPGRSTETRLYRAVDVLNRRFGRREKPAVQVASTHLRLPGERPAWAGARVHCSPAYTTRWDSLPVVRA